MSKKRTIKKGQYMHFKGGKYDVLGVAKHTETLDDLIIYKPLYKCEKANLWARPFDMFIDQKKLQHKNVKRFKYIGPVKQPQIEVHVGTICFQDKKCLVLKRAKKRSLYPELWECGGGKVRNGETFEDAAKRQMKEEADVDIEITDVLCTYNIPIPEREQKVIPGLKFTCKISKDQKIEISKEHEEWQLIGQEEIENFEFIPGIDDDIREAFKKIQ
jgi:hypothetical protein